MKPTPMVRRSNSRLSLCAAGMLCGSVLTSPLLANEPSLAASAPGPGPEVLAVGLVSTAAGEYSPTVDLEGQRLVFMRRTPGLFDYTLMSSEFVGGQWASPTVLPFSGEYRDGAPMFSPDGEWLYFDSRRPMSGDFGKSINLWRVSVDHKEWGDPEPLRAVSRNLPSAPRAGQDEFGPVLDGEGTLWFYSFREPHREGTFYRSVGPDHVTFSRDNRMPDPSAATFVSYLSLAPDGRTAILEGRSTQPGRQDTELFYSCQDDNGDWALPKALDSVNSPEGDGGGYLTADGQVLVFSSSRAVDGLPEGSANLFWQSTESLPIPCT